MSRRCAIMQPTYFPWSGYFNLISSVDYFYYLDDAQYERGSWHNRNQILLDGKSHWLTVPVLREFLGQNLHEVLLDPLRSNWRRKHLDSIKHAYSRCPHAKDLSDILHIIEEGNQRVLADINIDLIEQICLALDIKTPRLRSSKRGISLPRSEKLVELCCQADCSEYISPIGAKKYLIADNFENLSHISLYFQDFQPTAYPQPKVKNFISHLSILDVIANLGIQASKDYVHGQFY